MMANKTRRAHFNENPVVEVHSTPSSPAPSTTPLINASQLSVGHFPTMLQYSSTATSFNEGPGQKVSSSHKLQHLQYDPLCQFLGFVSKPS